MTYLHVIYSFMYQLHIYFYVSCCFTFFCQTEVAIKFWSNGFSVDDGPLRSLEDPENKQFLDSVTRG